MRKLFIIPLLAVIYFFKVSVTPATVTRVIDGDTFEVKVNGQKRKIRLYGIDAPELRQPYGQEAKRYLTSFLLNREVLIEDMGTDKYGRETAIASIKMGKSTILVNEELLRNGFAWHMTFFDKSTHCLAWEVIAQEAQRDKIGLWADPNPVKPFEYRKTHKKH